MKFLSHQNLLKKQKVKNGDLVPFFANSNHNKQSKSNYIGIQEIGQT